MSELSREAVINLLVEHGIVAKDAMDDPEGYDRCLRESSVKAFYEALRSLAPLSATAATSVWEVSTRTFAALFESEELAQKYIGQFGASVGGGMSISERPIHRAAAPAPAEPVGKLVNDWQDCGLCGCKILSGRHREPADPKETSARVEAGATASGNPLLWNVYSMCQQSDPAHPEWRAQWRELLAAIEQHLQRANYPADGPCMKGEQS